MSSEIRHLLDVADLTDAELDQILTGPELGRRLASGTVVGLLFLESSLRTRFGFGVAAERLGASALSVGELRYGAEMSSAEAFADTLRAVAGMSDLVVVRAGIGLDRHRIRKACPTPVINGGDRGGEHPTQALIDVFAMQRFAGPVHELNIGVCGDLTMRASRSLIRLLDRRPPLSLRLIAPPARMAHEVNLGGRLRDRTTVTDCADFSGLDVLLMTGLAPGNDTALTERERQQYALTASSITSLPHHAVVLSPMPVIDEISDEIRGDPRVRIHDHSDLGVPVRMAVLQLMLANRLA